MRQTPKRAEITLWRNNLQDTQHCSAHTPNGHGYTKYIFQKYLLKYLKYITFAIFAAHVYVAPVFQKRLLELTRFSVNFYHYRQKHRIIKTMTDTDSSLSHIRHDASSSDSSLPSYGSCLVLLVCLCCCRDFAVLKTFKVGKTQMCMYRCNRISFC